MNNSKYAFFILVVVFSLLFLPSNRSYGQSKYDKAVAKVHISYDNGDYAKAVKLNEKLKKKVVKKLGNENGYMVTYHYLAARNNLAMGLLNEFDASIDASEKLSLKVYADNPQRHAFLLNSLANLLLQNYNPKKALEYVKLATAAVEGQSVSPTLKARTELNLAEIFSAQGYYTQAIAFIAENEKFYASRTSDKEVYEDDKGNLKTRKLSGADVEARKTEYAELLNLKANTLRNRGDFDPADSAFVAASYWISQNLNKKHILNVQNKLYHGQMLEENGIDPKESRKIYEDALSYLKADYNPAHYLGLQVYESLLNSYLINDEMTRFKHLKTQYNQVIKKNFSTKSLHNVRLDALEFNARLDKERTRNIEDQALKLLASTTKIPEFHQQRIKLYEYAYKAALVNRNYSNADRYLNEILRQKAFLFGDRTPVYHLTMTEMANFYIDFTEKFEEAGEIYETSFNNIVKKEIKASHISYVRTLNHIARYQEAADDLKGATATLEEALIATRKKYDNTDPLYGDELEKVAALQLNMGEFKEAEKNIQDALEILYDERRDKFNVVYYVKALETSARLNSLKGEFESAEDDIIRSQRLLQRAESLVNYDEIASTIGLADVYVKFGRISKTEELLVDAIEEYEQLYGQNSRNLIAPLLSYGNLKVFTGEYTEADEIARRALAIANEKYGDTSTKTAYCKKLIVEVNAAIGDYEKAEQNIREVLEIQREILGNDHIEVAKSLSQLGLIQFLKGLPPENIEPVFEESKSIIEEQLGNRTPMYADVLKDLSALYIQESRFDDAFNALGLAETIWELRVDSRRNVNVADIYMLTGDIYYQQKNYQKAEAKYDQALDLYERFFSEEHPEYVRILSKLSKVYYMQGDKRRAKKTIQQVIENYDTFIKVYFPALSEREKSKFWNTIKSDYEFYNTIGLAFMEEDPQLVETIFNNALATKAILLSSSIKIRERILNGDDAELKQLYNEWLAKKEFLTSVLSMRTDQLADNEIDPISLGEEVEDLERQLSAKSDIFGTSSEQNKITWENIQEVLDENEVAVEMVRFRHFDHIFTDSVIYAGLYIKNEKEQKKPGIFVIRNGDELEGRYLNVYKNSIKFKRRDRYSFNNYWAPISAAVGATSTIYFSADGVYNQINLEAIPTGEERYVIDDSNIIMVSNTKDIYLNTLKKAEEKKSNASMFGNPIYYLDETDERTISQLPGTELEINELQDLLKINGWTTSTKLETAATEQEIKLVNSPRIFHVATHGFFTPAREIEQNALADQKAATTQNPLLRTGLLLTGAGDLLSKTDMNYNIEDGILTAYEAMSMNLDDTDLVVLSACETGLGELSHGEGVYGLQRAFMVAGAQTLIMSLFKVPDTATQKLMVNFYKKWLATGNKRQSFIEAKKELRNEYKDPYYWGAFVMIGLE